MNHLVFTLYGVWGDARCLELKPLPDPQIWVRVSPTLSISKHSAPIFELPRLLFPARKMRLACTSCHLLPVLMSSFRIPPRWNFTGDLSSTYGIAGLVGASVFTCVGSSCFCPKNKVRLHGFSVARKLSQIFNFCNSLKWMATIAIILWKALYDIVLGSSGSSRKTATPNDPLIRLKATQLGGRQRVHIHTCRKGERFSKSIFHFVHRSHSNTVSVFLHVTTGEYSVNSRQEHVGTIENEDWVDPEFRDVSTIH
jgi:hypothetical protein